MSQVQRKTNVSLIYNNLTHFILQQARSQVKKSKIEKHTITPENQSIHIKETIPELKNIPIKYGDNTVRNEFLVTKDPHHIQEHSQELPFEDTNYQPKQFDSRQSQSHPNVGIEAGHNLQKADQICPKTLMGFQASIHLHSSLDGRDTLGNTKLRVIQEHRTPHVKDIIGVVYENATTKVLNCFLYCKVFY